MHLVSRVDPDPDTGGLDPAHSWGPDCIDFLENVLHWELTGEQRLLYLHALEMGDGGVGFRHDPADPIAVSMLPTEQQLRWVRGLSLWRTAARACRSRLCAPADCLWRPNGSTCVQQEADG